MPPGAPPAYAQECGACHLAYPPGLLPARSWQRLAGGLDHHFGTDASLDAATAQSIATWLQAHAARGGRAAEEPPQDRITRAAWFQRKHRHIEPAVWTLPAVRGAAHCAACHEGAARGRFDDDALRQPAGLTPRQRRAWSD
ncbi:Ni,Fe-hydrogenase I cytochrome b subunit [Piscinibacter sakaiensis]|uniref:Ni,Fe-hydrogenase I cytochrome b subunit n=2 Tax=Piscinibacter sakaiensis TaxID=1547922 RepID=A0A0K8P814_PISS1|nr:Ni,Fe-hydrogenase I cytochrome b subunit [Piscinibacter sakaiensis]